MNAGLGHWCILVFIFNLDIFLPAFQLMLTKHCMAFSSQISYETSVIKNENNNYFLEHLRAICGDNNL